MKDIPVEQIERLQYEINERNLTLRARLRSMKAFKSIELPEITSPSGGKYKTRTVHNTDGQSIRVYFYPPDMLAALQHGAADEPTRVELEAEDFAYLPA